MRANNLVDDCQSNAMLFKAAKMLMVIPFLPSPTESPANNMLEGFQTVREFAQEKSLPNDFQKVLDYVDSFWFSKVTCDNFTIYQKKIHIVKYIEKFQLGLLSLVKPDANIWDLTSKYFICTVFSNPRSGPLEFWLVYNCSDSEFKYIILVFYILLKV